jgi:hypothetical protein
VVQLLEAFLTAEVATTLSFTVEVGDEAGRPIQGFPVTLVPAQGSGTITPTSVSTGAMGTITIQWTLGTAAGIQSVRVSAGAKSVTVEATATPGAPSEVRVASGNGQTGQVGLPLSAPIVIAVQDRFGNHVPDVGVHFSTDSGLLADLLVISDAGGEAETSWSLGGTLGSQTMSASALNLTAVQVTATGIPGPPASLVVMSGDAQSGVVGEALAESIVFEARDAFANPAIGAAVDFSGDGSTDPLTGAADDQGRVAVTWTLGTEAGSQALEAAAGSATAAVAAVAQPGAPASLKEVSGGGQQSYATATLVKPIVVRVLDAFGNMVPETAVTFVATTGGGSVSPTGGDSDTNGLAQTTWTLGGLVGTHVLEAGADGTGTLSIEATAVSGPPASIAATSGGGQAAVVGTVLPTGVVVQVLDASGNPVPGVAVALSVTSGGGSLTPSSGVTEAAGEVSTTWTLGTTAGAQTMRATVDGIASRAVSATAEPGPPSQFTKHSGDGQNPVISTAVTVPPAVFVGDAFGNPIQGVAVTFGVEFGGGSLTGADQATGVTGIARVGSWTVGGAVGANVLSASAAGLDQLTFNANTVLAPVYSIEVRFVGTPPSAVHQNAFAAAASRWESLIVGDLTDGSVSLSAGICGQPSIPAVNETIDDLLIFAEVGAIDGVGGILGRAGPCFIRVANGLPIIGYMEFDEPDLDGLAASGHLEDVVLHEMAHVLGLGTLSLWDNQLVGAGGVDPFFTGANAVAKYTAAGGAAVNAVPVANTGGAGTRDSHWREADMGRELMTGFLNTGVTNFLSAISVGALSDMGYAVDYGAVDAYTVFPGALRSSEDRLIELIELVMPPPMTMDAQGRVGPRRR